MTADRTLHHFPLDPASRQVRLALGEKRLAFSEVTVRYWERPEGLTALNASGLTPVLTQGDLILCESRAILDHLEEAHPEPALLGREPAERAEARRLLQWFDRKFDYEVGGFLLHEKMEKRLMGMGAPDLSAARAEMETNYFGPLALCRAFAPILGRHKESAIANVLSAGGLVAVPGMGGYSPSKFAGRALATCLRAELAPQNTSVTALIVGSVDTRMASHVQGAKETPETIALAALKAIRRGADEVDTDIMAIEVRAHSARDPKAYELLMRRSLSNDPVTTGR